MCDYDESLGISLIRTEVLIIWILNVLTTSLTSVSVDLLLDHLAILSKISFEYSGMGCN